MQQSLGRGDGNTFVIMQPVRQDVHTVNRGRWTTRPVFVVVHTDYTQFTSNSCDYPWSNWVPPETVDHPPDLRTTLMPTKWASVWRPCCLRCLIAGESVVIMIPLLC